ncbi:MAG: DUF3659 domain-containing protein, partial [Alphaproteobacteria bacterium]|nr:DUF3659 domain-containing protein [Alphaproteobacteria bacterium]
DNRGNVIGKEESDGEQYVFDDEGRLVGVSFPDGDVFDFDGNLIGNVDSNGVVKEVAAKSSTAPKIGEVGKRMSIARDEDGNVIGYIDEKGNLVDENGNIIGRVDESGNVYDNKGNIIGHSEERVNLVLDEKGKTIGYIDEKGTAHDKSGKIIGVADAVGNVRALGTKVIGSTLNKSLVPITPAGTVLGTINNRGEVVDQKKVLGKMRTDGLVTDLAGSRILARGIPAGYLVNWGCDYSHKLDKDGVVRHNGENTDYRMHADGTAWTSDGKFVGKIIKTGPVYDEQCRYLGEVSADGYVRNVDNEEIGCVNPDGTILDLEEPVIKGHLVEKQTVISSRNWKPIGRLESNGTLKNSAGDVIGCSNAYGDVYDSRHVYIGSVSKGKYAYGFDGKYLGGFDLQGNLKIKGVTGAYLTINNLIADKNGRIIGYMMPEVAVFTTSSGQKIGHLFPDGMVYNDSGMAVDKFNGGESGYYGGVAGRVIQPKQVVDIDGQNIGVVNYDLKVVNYQGTVIGKVDAKGQMFDERGRLIGGTVRQGGARGYNGDYLGYVVPTGEVVELEDVKANNRQYRRGEVTGKVTPDGKVIKDGKIIGEVLEQNIIVDVFGQPVGLSNDRGEIITSEFKTLGLVLPGGGNKDNYSSLKTGIIIDFGGKPAGVALPTGDFMNKNHVISGRILSDGKVISSDGRFVGEVVSGDIVIGNNDSVQGRIGFDGVIYNGGTIVGRILTDGLAIDRQNNIIGRTYIIGNTILSNSGQYMGRLAANGRVLTANNKEIGYIKSNGSFVDIDKNVAGYSLPEVARNRRN